MKKTLIILLLLLGLTWLLIAPRLVGGYLDRWIPDWLDEMGLAESARFDSGWFHSTLRVEDALTLELRTRHFPPFGLDWIQVDGDLGTPLSASAFALNGELTLGGASLFEIDAPDLRLTGPIELSSGPAKLSLNQFLDQPSTMKLRLLDLMVKDALGNQLLADQAELVAEWSRVDDDNLALSLTSEVKTSDPLALALTAEPVQREALGDLIQGLQQLARTEPQSTAQQFALLTVAGAWQQLSQNGLTITLDRLQLGEENQLSGDWTADQGQPMIEGSGSLQSLNASLQAVVGLSTRRSPEGASILIQTWLDQLIARGWLSVEGDRFEFRYAGADDPQP